MSHFFPTAEYPEDQPLAHTILTTHVLYRGFQAGAILGLITSSTTSLLNQTPITPSLLVRSAGFGAPIGTGLLGLALVGRMWGREEIEWKDRSWALQRNKGQVAVDDWSQSGAVLGGGLGGVWIWKSGYWYRTRSSAVSSVVSLVVGRVVGGAAVGSLVGTVGCLVWGRLKGFEE